MKKLVPTLAEPLIIQVHARASACVYMYECGVDRTYAELAVLANAPGVTTFTVVWTLTQHEIMTPTELLALVVTGDRTRRVQGDTTRSFPGENTLGTETWPTADAVQRARGVVTTLLASVGLILDRDEIGSCRACAKDAEFAAAPCDDLLYCRDCMAKHLSCLDLVHVCPVCFHFAVSFVTV